MFTPPRIAIYALSAALLLGACSRGEEPRSTPKKTPQASVLPAPKQGSQPEAGDPVKKVTQPWKPGDFQKGIQIYWHTHGSNADIRARTGELLDYIVGLHANSVGITFPIYTDGATPTKVYSGPETPSPAELSIILNEAKARGLRTMIRPTINEVNIVESRADAWRGTIDPVNTAKWFRTYRATLNRYVPTTVKYKVDEIVAGTELNSMERHTDEWKALQREIRARGYHGMISYAFNWDVTPDVPFRNLAIDAYPSIQLPDTASVPRLAREIKAWYNQKSPEFRHRLVAQEVGIPARGGMYPSPWNWGTGEGSLNLNVQANWFAAMCRATKSAGLRGIYYWSVDSSTELWNVKPKTDYSGSFVGRPAERSISRCFSN